MRGPNFTAPTRNFPFGHFTDVKCLQAGLAVFAFRAMPVRLALKQKHRSAFQVLPRIKQFMRCGHKNLGYPQGITQILLRPPGLEPGTHRL